jgi:hypothetical protein
MEAGVTEAGVMAACVMEEDDRHIAEISKYYTIEELQEICRTQKISVSKDMDKHDYIQLILDNQVDQLSVTDSDITPSPGTPSIQKMEQMVTTLEGAQEKGKEKQIAPWFTTDFLMKVLNERLDKAPNVNQENSTPTLFVLVGPASVGKSSAKTIIPELSGIIDQSYLINFDVDEIKIYGSEMLGSRVSKSEKREVPVIEGIKQYMPEVLAKLIDPIFVNATMGGDGNYKNIILDTTGSMYAMIKAYIRKAKDLGYRIKVIIVYSDKTQCLERVIGRNAQLIRNNQQIRVMEPSVVSSIYDQFLKKNQANLYAISEKMIALTDELILVDNHSDTPKIVATRTKQEETLVLDIPQPSDHESLVDKDGAFYGLTLKSGQSQSIEQGNIRSAREKAAADWLAFDGKKKMGTGGFRKRRISRRRRIRGTRAKKTIKKYYHPHTRRHNRRRSQRR